MALVSVCSTAEAVRPQHEPFLDLGRDAGCAPRAWHTPGALPAPPRLRAEGMSGEKESHTGLPARARAYRRERRACPEGCTGGRLGCACRLHGSWLRRLGMLRTPCPRRQSWTCRRDPGAEWGHRSGRTQRRPWKLLSGTQAILWVRPRSRPEPPRGASACRGHRATGSHRPPGGKASCWARAAASRDLSDSSRMGLGPSLRGDGQGLSFLLTWQRPRDPARSARVACHGALGGAAS